MFNQDEFKEYFSHFFGEFNDLYAEFQNKSAIYGDFWQFLLVKAAKELGMIDRESDRQLTQQEVMDLYQKITAMMPQEMRDRAGLPPIKSEDDESSPKEDVSSSPDSIIVKPGFLPKPDWFNLKTPPEKEKKEP
ncbi:MAG: hypothetical protein NTU59_07575 [Coprothermobacterota bacterium]|nr:hypothetical protein [Coprothermobacterota bacterium]